MNIFLAFIVFLRLEASFLKVNVLKVRTRKRDEVRYKESEVRSLKSDLRIMTCEVRTLGTNDTTNSIYLPLASLRVHDFGDVFSPDHFRRGVA